VARDRSEPDYTDILPHVTSALTSIRRLLTVAAAGLWLGAASLALAGPASADVPEGWDVPEEVDTLNAILLLGGVPLLLFVVITFLVYAPSVIRGERIAPGPATTENQWLGGPRKTTSELAGPDTEESQAGGASGRW
jgi:hypothetical protein